MTLGLAASLAVFRDSGEFAEQFIISGVPMERHGVNRITDGLMDREVTIRINVGLDRARLIHDERNAAFAYAQQHHDRLLAAHEPGHRHAMEVGNARDAQMANEGMANGGVVSGGVVNGDASTPLTTHHSPLTSNHSPRTRPMDDLIGHIADLVLERLLGQAA
jgi:hypothetical protein